MKNVANHMLNQVKPVTACAAGASGAVRGSDCYDLVIVGGGIAGTTLACALRQSGLQVALIEAEAQSPANGQAYNLSPLSSQIFAGLGILESILPQIAAYTKIHLSDADHPQAVQFLPQDLGLPLLGYVAEHRVLLTALQAALASAPTVQMLCPAKVLNTEFAPTGVRLEVLVNGAVQVIWTRLVVAADGARSPLRQQAGIATRGWQYWQSCIVATVKPERPHHQTAYERFKPNGPFAILPIPGDRCRIVWTATHQQVADIMTWDDRRFLQELSRQFGDQMGQLALEGERAMFRVQLMQSDRYVQSRLALIGDAAHCCHPVGGQGMNMGIRDAAALAEVLLTAHQQGEDLADLAVLKRYERWRQGENWLILGFTDLLDRTFSTTFLPIVMMRRCGLWLLEHVGPLKSLALRFMTGLTGRTPALAQGLAVSTRSGSANLEDVQSTGVLLP
jgi:2-octaprenyl-6-methoxyphenol hydroxylase